MGKINRQFFIWSSSGLIITLTIWMVVGNLIAAQLEKKIDEAKEQFRRQFPKQEANNSALKLEELTAKLGITVNLGNTTKLPARYTHISEDKTKAQEFQKIRKELDDYLNAQLEKPTDEIDIPPEKLRQYLKSNESLLAAIQNHVLNSELPQWEIDDASNYTYTDALPSFFTFANLQKVLILDILEKTRLGKNQEAVNSLEVSWKINQYLLKNPFLISSSVHIIVVKLQTAEMRKIPNLLPIWQSRLEQNIKYNLPQSLLNSLTLESFIPSNYFRDRDFNANSMNTENNDEYSINLPFLNTVRKPYYRLIGFDYWDKMNQIVSELPKEYNCSFNPKEFAKKYKIAPAWWNFTDVNAFTGQWGNVIRLAVQMELTQKIIQIKEIANKQGNWPKKIEGIESSAICKDAQWIYQVNDNGIMSISLNKDFEMLKKRPNEKGYIPLKYSAKYKK